MRILKRILLILLTLIGILFFTCVIIISVDRNRTAYLDVENIENSEVNSYLIGNVHVIPMTMDTVLRNYMVLVEDGRVTAVDSILEKDNIAVVDGGQGYLLPGLVDMHVHVWDRYELGLYLASGVTAIRNVWGMPMHLRMKKDIGKDHILAPMFYTTGPKLTGPEFIGSDNLNISSPEEAVKRLRSYKRRGYDFIKTYYGLPEDIFDAIITEAEVLDMDIVAHPSQKVPYAYHLNPQIASIEHAEDIVQQPLNYELDTALLKDVINELSASSHTSFCPTLIAYFNIYNMMQDDEILSRERIRQMNPLIRRVDSEAQFDRWHMTKSNDPNAMGAIRDQHMFHLRAIREMQTAGVNIICGSDAGIGVTIPGSSIHEELGLYRQAGLTNYEVLRTATANVAQTHRQLNDQGTIEKNKVANLILVRTNPLNDLTALQDPDIVFIEGRKLDRQTLELFRARAHGRSNLVATLLRYVENTLVEK